MTKTARHSQLHFRRFEFKYIVTIKQARQIREKVGKYLRLDPFSLPTGCYQVNSLYFDSPGMRFYYETEAGLAKRIKLRQRYYNDSLKEFFWEIKRKNNADVTKDRYYIQKPDLQLKKEIDYLTTLYRLRPVVLISYVRHPFVAKNHPLRITFDSQVTATRVSGNKREFPVITNQTVLEIKFRGKLPYWTYRIIKSYSLERQAISKYRLAIEKAQMLR